MEPAWTMLSLSQQSECSDTYPVGFVQAWLVVAGSPNPSSSLSRYHVPFAWQAPFTQQLELAQHVLPHACGAELGHEHMFCEQVFPPVQSLFCTHSTHMPEEAQCLPPVQPLQPPQWASVLIATQVLLQVMGALDGQAQEPPVQVCPPVHIWVLAPEQAPLPLHFPVT